MDNTLSSNITGSDDEAATNDIEHSETLSTTFGRTSEGSSASSSASMSNSDSPRKRKRHAGSTFDHRSSPSKIAYSDKYRRLLNDAIKDVHLDSLGPDTEGFANSQIGISKWSPQEKELLFQGLAHYGRDDLPAITTLIATKSELEVRVILQLLREASTKQHMYGSRRSLVGMVDIPAAIEVSQQCYAQLEQAADALAALQQRHEEKHERQNHGDLWKLNQKTAAWVERCMHEGEEGKTEIHEKLPAAEILNLRMFLKLSEQLFMNSSDSASNWRTYVPKRDAYRKEGLSILYTAFSDMHNVVTSITRRLIQSSLFFAMSRLRASQLPFYKHHQVVKRCDVAAALRAVGMKESGKDEWVKVARRCRLSVYDNDPEDIMSYTKVERFLGQRELATDAGTSSESENKVGNSHLASSQEHSQSESCSSMASGGDRSPSQSSATSDEPESGNKFEEKTDAYLEYIDNRASREEELRLWKILDKDPPPNLLAEATAQIKRPKSFRHDRDDLDDWRDWISFRLEWEAYGVENLDLDLVNDRKQALQKDSSSTTLAGRRRARSRIRPTEEDHSPQVSRSSGASQLGAMSRSDTQYADSSETFNHENALNNSSSAEEAEDLDSMPSRHDEPPQEDRGLI
ncbi:MAG: hypothetical protein Q9201_003771 [Fulgogasparrea decipioides]